MDLNDAMYLRQTEINVLSLFQHNEAALGPTKHE
jgi:hypothetical protein